VRMPNPDPFAARTPDQVCNGRQAMPPEIANAIGVQDSIMATGPRQSKEHSPFGDGFCSTSALRDSGLVRGGLRLVLS
jgi:hypothetical protein